MNESTICSYLASGEALALVTIQKQILFSNKCLQCTYLFSQKYVQMSHHYFDILSWPLLLKLSQEFFNNCKYHNNT